MLAMVTRRFALGDVCRLLAVAADEEHRSFPDLPLVRHIPIKGGMAVKFHEVTLGGAGLGAGAVATSLSLPSAAAW